MAGNPSKDTMRQPLPQGGDQSSVQDLSNQSYDPKFRTFIHQNVGSPDGVNMYTQKVGADGAALTSDATGQAIAQAVYNALILMQPIQQAIPYARDISDQMRVNVAQGSVTVNALTWANNGSYASYYAQGAPNAIDTREQLELQSLTNFNLARNSRWTFA